MCQTAAAQVGNGIAGLLTGVTGKRNNVDQRRLVEHIRNRTVVDSLRNRCVLVNRTQRQTYCQTQTLGDDGALFKHALTVLRFFTWDNGVWQLLYARIIPVLIRQTGNLGKDLSPDFGDRRCNPSHLVVAPFPLALLLFPASTVITARRSVERFRQSLP